MKLILFDIDGTLIVAGGAGRRALNSAFRQVLGVADAMARVRLDGNTDYLIIKEALAACCRDFEPGVVDALVDSYLRFLGEELSSGSSGYRVLPGVSPLLDRLSREHSVVLGLATGNLEQAARLKLEPAGLNSYFPVGGYGSDSEHRFELILKAIDRAKILNPSCSLGRVVLVGDTPNDILHGQRAGADVIAVATGSYTLEDLRSCNPEFALASLESLETVLDWIL